MQAHPDIARGTFKGSKEELNRVWRSLETELNAAGPPSKGIAEWKKVWSDQKKYIRKKSGQTPLPPAKKIKMSLIDLDTQISDSGLLAEDSGIEKKVPESISKELIQNTEKIYRSIDYLCELKKQELEEQKRHNEVMEKFRQREVEDKIDLKQIKTVRRVPL